MDSDSSAFGKPSGKQSEAASYGLPLWCATCRSDQHLILHAIGSLSSDTDELLVHVNYACTACGSFHAHAAPFQQVAALLNGSDAAPGLLFFGEEYLHCGIPMTVAGTALRSVQPPLSAAETDSDLPGVVLATKIMQCACGFRLELPA